MSTEIELKLQLTAKSARKLAAHPLLAQLPSQKQHLLNTYYDTPELQLHARRIAMRFRKKGAAWLLTVKSAEPASGGLAVRSEWETAAKPGIFEFAHVDDRKMRDFLEAAAPRMEAIFTTDFHRQIWRVPFGSSLIELALDRGSIDSQGKSCVICEVELELLSGEIDDIFKLTRKLQDKLDLSPAIASKAERGYNLFNDEPLRPFKATSAEISAEMQPVEAFRVIALGCLEHFQRNEQGLLSNEDPEFIHQARVALRRLRSAIKLFAPVLPREFVTTYGQTWKTLASALGEARNWDVFLEETLPPIQAAFPDNREIRVVRDKARRHAKSTRRAVTKLLGVSEYSRLMMEFTAAIYALNDTRPVALKDFINKRLAEHTQFITKRAGKPAVFSAEKLHQFRISLKKLRYALEFFTPLIQTKSLTAYLNNLSKIQTELGIVNDLSTAKSLINESHPKTSSSIIQGWIAGQNTLLTHRLAQAIKNWINRDPAH